MKQARSHKLVRPLVLALALAVPGAAARVVKAFNTIFASLFATPASATADVPVFVAGDDEAAVAAVAMPPRAPRARLVGCA